MKMWKKLGSGLALLAGLSPTLRGQVPPAPPPAPVAAAPAAAPNNLWSFLCPTPEQKAACKDKLCNSKLGQLMNNGLRPMGALSGGLIGPFCPGFTQDDLKKPADSAEGAAGRIKKDTADAKARVAAVRYLATVDCHYWPEAQDALVNALRADRNECVRFEAALALGSGCCCTKKTIEALSIAVSGSEADNNPRETSERVRSAALAALEGCLARLGGPTVPLQPAPVQGGEKPPMLPPEKAPGAVLDLPRETTTYYRQVDTLTPEQVTAKARFTVNRHAPMLKTARTSAGTASAQGQPSPVSDGSLTGIFGRALSPARAAAAPTATTKPAAQTKPTATPPRQAAEPQPANVTPTSAATPPPKTVVMTVPTANPYPMTTPAQAAPTAGRGANQVVPMSWNPLAERPQMAVVLPAAATTPHPLPGGNLQHALRALREGIEPEQREWAAANLAAVTWQNHPQVVEALQTSASKDAAPTVRVACIRGLGSMGVNTVTVVKTLQSLQKDDDPRVRREAGLALERVTGDMGR